MDAVRVLRYCRHCAGCGVDRVHQRATVPVELCTRGCRRRRARPDHRKPWMRYEFLKVHAGNSDGVDIAAAIHLRQLRRLDSLDLDADLPG